jgi:hypothetical protein
MLFATKDLKEEMQELTHDNILRDDVTLISSFYGNHEGYSECKQR